MAKEYSLGQRVVLAAVIKRCNPDKKMVVLVFPDGSQTDPLTWEVLEALETDAQSMIYVPHDTVQQSAPPADGD